MTLEDQFILLDQFTYNDIGNSMTLEDNITPLDPFTHTKQDWKKIQDFDFVKEKSTLGCYEQSVSSLRIEYKVLCGRCLLKWF